LFCLFDSRVSLAQEVKADISRFLNEARNSDCPWSEAQIVPVCIRRNIKLAEAPSYGKTVFEYEQNCHGAQDYSQLAEYIQTALAGSAGISPSAEKPPLKIVDIPASRPPSPPQQDEAGMTMTESFPDTVSQEPD
jgi:chromosome partitioning protein